MITSARYENYGHIADAMPLVLHSKIERTPFCRSTEQNWHKELEIEICREGEGRVLLDGEHHDFCVGDVIVVNSDVMHHTGSDERIVYDCIIINLDFCRAVGIDPEDLTFSSKIKSERIIEIINSICIEYYNYSKSFQRTRLCGILASLLLELATNHSRFKCENTCERRSLVATRNALSFINRNYSERISLDEIARSAYIDKYALCREFKKATGQTVVEYLNLYRVQRAAELIKNGSTVAEAAHLCGFENVSFFTKVFKKYMHTLPSSYKQKIQKINFNIF